MEPQEAVVKIEESIERLLTPTSRSISFTLSSDSNAMAKRHKPFVVKTLDKFVSVSFDFLLNSFKL